MDVINVSRFSRMIIEVYLLYKDRFYLVTSLLHNIHCQHDLLQYSFDLSLTKKKHFFVIKKE